jgi:hypothetical protein
MDSMDSFSQVVSDQSQKKSTDRIWSSDKPSTIHTIHSYVRFFVSKSYNSSSFIGELSTELLLVNSIPFSTLYNESKNFCSCFIIAIKLL